MEAKGVESPAAAGGKEAAGEAAPGRKMSYGELRDVAAQLGEQNRRLAMRVRELEGCLGRADVSVLFGYLGFLFEVVKGPASFDGGFVAACGGDIQRCMDMLRGVVMPGGEAVGGDAPADGGPADD